MSGNIINFYKEIPKHYVSGDSAKRTYASYNKIHIDLPFRALIIGASGSMKTNTLVNLIKDIGAFQKIYLIAKNLHQPLYDYLKDVMGKLSEKMGYEILEETDNIDEVPDLDKIDGEQNTLIIFDDLLTEKLTKLKKVSDLWIRGRSKNISTIFITQSYFRTPKLIRENTDILILKRINTRNDLSLILKEYANDLDKEQLIKLYTVATSKNPQDFFLIDCQTTDPHYKYRANYKPLITDS